VNIAGPDWFSDMRWRVAAETGGAAAGLLALIVMARFVDKRGLDTIGLPPSGALRDLVDGTILGIVIFAVPIVILLALGMARFDPDYSKFSGTALAMALLYVFVNVLDQEFLVRSYLFQEVWRRYSATAAVVVSTVVFVALHAGAISKGINGELAGIDVLFASILLGVAYLRTKALWLPIGIHFGWNGLQGPVLGINVTGTDPGGPWHAFSFQGADLWTGGTMGIEGGLAGLAGPLVGIALVVFLFRRRENEARRLGEPIPT